MNAILLDINCTKEVGIITLKVAPITSSLVSYSVWSERESMWVTPEQLKQLGMTLTHWRPSFNAEEEFGEPAK